MNKGIRDSWVEALRSGTYHQATGMLRDKHGNFCCLGVLCDLAEREGVVESRAERAENIDGVTVEIGTSYGTAREFAAGEGSDGFLPLSVRIWAGLDEGDLDPTLGPSTASQYNDRGDTFATIADLIERYL